jgi:hypothetical protein
LIKDVMTTDPNRRGQSTRFERTGKVPRKAWLAFVAGCAPVAFVFANAATSQNFLPAFLALGMLLVGVALALLRPVFMYVRVTEGNLIVRRGFYSRQIPITSIGGIHLFKLAYPGLRSHPGPMGVVVDRGGLARARVVFIGWTPDELAGLAASLEAPVIGNLVTAPTVGPVEVNAQWQGILGRIGPVYGYVVLAVTYLIMALWLAVVAWAVIANSPGINAPR